MDQEPEHSEIKPIGMYGAYGLSDKVVALKSEKLTLALLRWRWSLKL